MTIEHVLTGQTPTSPYETWAKAHADLAAADSVVAAGATLYVDSAHAKDYGGSSTTLSFTNGTLTAPIKVVSVANSGVDGADDTYTPGATETLTGAADFIITGNVEFWGVSFVSADNISVGGTVFDHYIVFRDGTLNCDDLFLRNSSGGSILFYDMVIDFDARITFSFQELRAEFHGCTFIRNDTGSIDTFIIVNAADAMTILLEDCDLSNANLDQLWELSGTNQRVVMRRCKLNAGVTLLSTDITTAGTSLLVEYCEAGTPSDIPNGLQLYADRFGRVSDDTTSFFTTGGSNDGVRSYSRKMVSDSAGHTEENWNALKTPPFGMYVTGGSEITVTVRVASNATLQNDECWLELSGPRAAPFDAQGFFRTTRPGATDSIPCGNPQTTPTNLTAGAGSEWTGGAEVGTEQEIAITWTPAENGPVILKVALGKPGQTIYVDLNPTVT